MFATKKSHNSLIPVRLGGLLISAGVVRSDQMALALADARRGGRKIGEMLVSQNLCSDEDLRCALELQQMIKSGSITVEMGTKALRLAREKQRNIHAALTDMGWSDANAIKATDLATILMEAGVLTKGQIDQASWNAAKNLLPLGRNLVLAGALTPSMLGSALNALILLRDKAVERRAAIDALRTAHQQKISFDECLKEVKAIVQNHVRVGELLSAAGLLSESDAMIAVENGLLNQKSIGAVLLESRMITPVVLDACLKLQKLIEENSISKVQAGELLRQVSQKQVGLEQFLNEMNYLKSRVLELLLASGLVTQEDIECAIAISPECEHDLIRALSNYGVMSQDMFRTAVRCVYAIDNGTHSKDAMVGALCAQFERMAKYA